MGRGGVEGRSRGRTGPRSGVYDVLGAVGTGVLRGWSGVGKVPVEVGRVSRKGWYLRRVRGVGDSSCPRSSTWGLSRERDRSGRPRCVPVAVRPLSTPPGYFRPVELFTSWSTKGSGTQSP